jgi:hypothetical protein
MKKTFSMLAIASALSLASLNAAIYTVYSGSAVALGSSGSDVIFSIPQFDASLGTLTGVTVEVVQSALTGSFTVTNQGLSSILVNDVVSDFRVRQSTPGLGYSQTLIEIDPLASSPTSSPSTTINVAANQTFNITAAQGYTISDQDISSTNFSAYVGVENVDFGVRNRLIVSTSGASFAVDSTDTITTTRMAITYTYTAIPEPSTALLGALCVLGLLRRRR